MVGRRGEVEKPYSSDSRIVVFTHDETETGYCNTGSLSTISSPEGTIQYNYDKLGRLVNESRTIIDGATMHEFTINQSYALAGRLEYF